MGNGRERSKRETFMEEKEKLHYPEWIEAIKEEEDVIPTCNTYGLLQSKF